MQGLIEFTESSNLSIKFYKFYGDMYSTNLDNDRTN